ncbi:TetR/AcrR family transcriptional regulator [Hymenobacter lutimineralis]|uniref:TetR/AcrR family transcriptional regulator n=1 Tax=Hymenobacter lutimineralis TaxID=2606448 RepID=A0A5D6V968_9BACT|nr:TetR/AcrR family transcriptional regulator [Hymenobacter lutimineralis]TYZ11369.1 TetR/AcrR family transcriptional regulator [Hymenobacter lutimineralis]
MTTPSLQQTLLEETQQLFLQHGIRSLSLERIIQLLNVSPATFQGMFADKDDLVLQVARQDLQRQRNEHATLFTQVSSPVERILVLLQHGIGEMQKVPGTNYLEIQQEHPATWELLMDHLTTYSYPQIQGLLNDGILQKQFRGDINIELVTKIILEQLHLILNPVVFPPSRYNLAEVFRSVYLYYIRGLCTEEGIQVAAAHFSRL